MNDTTLSQNLPIIVPHDFDPLPNLTTESVRVHLEAKCAYLEAELTNPRLTTGTERTVYALMIGKIKNAPSDASREYLIELLRETTALLQRRDGMNNDEAAYEITAGMTVTERQQARMKVIRAQRQQRLNWSRLAMEQLEEQQAETALQHDREASMTAVLDVLDETIDVIVRNERAVLRAQAVAINPRAAATAAPDLTMLAETLDNIMSIADPAPTLRPRVRMGM